MCYLAAIVCFFQWQFFFLALIYGQILFRPSCGYPRWACCLFVPQNLFMFLLFGDFYYKSYVKPQKKQQVNGQAEKG